MLFRSAAVSCVIRGYHVYKEVWSPNSGESFMCYAEDENIHDRNTRGNNAMTKLEGSRTLESAKNSKF